MTRNQNPTLPDQSLVQPQAGTSESDHEAMTSEGQGPKNDDFILSKGWILVGALAVLVGILSGLIMSGATFAR